MSFSEIKGTAARDEEFARLQEQFRPLLEKQISLFAEPGADPDSLSDWRQEALIGLFKAMEHYDQESGIKEDVKKALISAYEDIKKNGTKALEGLVDKGLAVRDLFAVSSDCADLLKYLPVEGNKLDLKFDLKLGKEEKIQAVIYVDGAWKKLPVVNNGDGTVTVTFEELGVVAFLGKTTGESPDTGDHSGAELVIWISLMAVSAIAIVALLVLVHRKKTDK